MGVGPRLRHPAPPPGARAHASGTSAPAPSRAGQVPARSDAVGDERGLPFDAEADPLGRQDAEREAYPVEPAVTRVEVAEVGGSGIGGTSRFPR